VETTEKKIISIELDTPVAKHSHSSVDDSSTGDRDSTSTTGAATPVTVPASQGKRRKKRNSKKK